MQRYHRIRHRLVWLLLGPLALAALIYALVKRPEMPAMDALPGKTSEDSRRDR